EYQSSDSAGHEHRNEANREKHRRRKANLCAPQRSDPVESFNRRRHPDRKGQDRKRDGRVWTHAAHEHVMTPHEEAQHADSENRDSTEVVNQAQQVSGMRIRDIPLVRMFRSVVMKFRAPSREPTQKIAMLITQRVTPIPCPGPAISPSALKGAYCVHHDTEPT